jgi:acyl carrier protein
MSDPQAPSASDFAAAPSTLVRLAGVLVFVLWVLRIPHPSVRPASCLSDLAPIDSLSLAELASAIDAEFRIQLPGEDLTTTVTVLELVGMIDACVGSDEPTV